MAGSFNPLGLASTLATSVMDSPITAFTMGAGLVSQFVGMQETMSGASDYNKAQVAEIGTQQKVEEQRKHFMELDNRRQQLENLRNTQKARATALSDASSQGASYGSGLQGGFGQVMGHGAFNQVGLSQSLEVGENIFGLDAQISQEKIAMANAQLQVQKGQGLSSFGQSLFGASTSLGNLFGEGVKKG